jgi:hypothetical protein
MEAPSIPHVLILLFITVIWLTVLTPISGSLAAPDTMDHRVPLHLFRW